eukprot:5362210-Pyramimonas_sp.AAC.1
MGNAIKARDSSFRGTASEERQAAQTSARTGVELEPQVDTDTPRGSTIFTNGGRLYVALHRGFGIQSGRAR